MSTQQRYIPHPPLSDFIEALWHYEGETFFHKHERRLPDGSMELVINLHEEHIRTVDRHGSLQSNRGGVLSGAHSEFSLLDTSSLLSVMGVHFKPGGAFPFLPFPASELHNTVISLDMLWGTEASDLHSQLLTASTPEKRFSLLERFLLAHLVRSNALHPAISFALKEFQDVQNSPGISAVTERIGLSQTRFIQVFREAVGMTPKQFCRVLRFQQVLRTWEKGTLTSGTTLALDCGYFDQAHFIHDFRAFSGLTPGTYLAFHGKNRNHIALPD